MCLDNPDPVMDSTLGPCTHRVVDLYIDGTFVCVGCGDVIDPEEEGAAQ